MANPCVGIAIVMPVHSELAAREVANGLVGSSQLIAPLLCNELLGSQKLMPSTASILKMNVVGTASRAWRGAAAALWHL